MWVGAGVAEGGGWEGGLSWAFPVATRSFSCWAALPGYFLAYS